MNHFEPRVMFEAVRSNVMEMKRLSKVVARAPDKNITTSNLAVKSSYGCLLSIFTTDKDREKQFVCTPVCYRMCLLQKELSSNHHCPGDGDQ
uniref:Ovule protein n=1 Tax=Steinernema glaseri TaxID=37863 RepID=A0A1I7ZEM4_9BILA